MKKIIAILAVLALSGCASRPASPTRTPHAAPRTGDPYSSIIYLQKSNESTFVPPKGAPQAPRQVKSLPIPVPSVPSEDCKNGQCGVPLFGGKKGT